MGLAYDNFTFENFKKTFLNLFKTDDQIYEESMIELKKIDEERALYFRQEFDLLVKNQTPITKEQLFDFVSTWGRTKDFKIIKMVINLMIYSIIQILIQ